MVPAPLSAGFESLPLLPTIKLEPSGAGFPSAWAWAHSRPHVGLSVRASTCSPVRLGVSPAAASTPTDVFTHRFEALFPRAGALGCVVCFRSPAVPPSLSVRECGAVGSASGRTACPIRSIVHKSLGLATSLRVLSGRLPISAPPTGLGECFFFNSLVVGLP